MNKSKVTMKYVNTFKRVFRCGYCELQDVFYGIDPQFYNSGVYGWNCDIYADYSKGLAITTGYRNMRGDRIPPELLNKYTEQAKEIRNKYTWTESDKMREALDKNAEDFKQALCNL